MDLTVHRDEMVIHGYNITLFCMHVSMPTHTNLSSNLLPRPSKCPPHTIQKWEKYENCLVE